jgi:hopanoid biosynthesis associated RND transporter like protein HpnN
LPCIADAVINGWVSNSPTQSTNGRVNDSSRPVSRKPSLIVRLVGASVARAPIVVAFLIILSTGMVYYVTHHFAMSTDTDALLSRKFPWRVRQEAFEAAFSQNNSDIVVVIDGQTPELSEAATARLAVRLGTQARWFHSIERPDSGPFWEHNRLLFASTEEVKKLIAQLIKIQPFLGSMASDPSLRGLANTLSLTMQGVTSDKPAPPELHTPIRTLADTLQGLAAGKPRFFSWRTLISGDGPDERELRHIILLDPVLDFTQLQPAESPVEAIRAAARQLQLDPVHGVRVRLTGSAPLQDEEFATLAQRAGLIASLASGAVILMLWFAVRSPWLIASILATTLVGLLTATALGLALFQRFNIISVAFIPLFVGMGIDLGIQFSVRYRAERRPASDVGPALLATAHSMGKSLTLAATAIGIGFLAFAPTAYYGVSQLGMIAGLGLFAALALNLTLLPALIKLARPPGVPERGPGARLTLIDNYVLEHRRLVLGVGALSALISVALLPLLHFDFNPMHLRSSKVESVATLTDLMRDPDESPITLEVIRPNLAAADRLAAIFRTDPTVYSARTLSRFIPTEQREKIALIADAANLLDFTLSPLDVATPPTDAEVIDSLNRATDKLRQAATEDPSLRADAGRLADELGALARGTRSARAQAEQVLIPGFVTSLEQVRNLLHPRPVSIDSLPPELVRQWRTADGRARVSVVPKGDPNDDAVVSRFIAAGIKVAPDAAGSAIYRQAYGRAVVDAFIEAGVLSFIAICVLLLIALRRVRDVAITMTPIVLTGLLTMGTCVLIGQPLNFANIIALPLLFGIGVAFHIYFVMSWRSGGSHLLTSSLARAVFFSALATATGFGSLWASSHPGTASMGELLMISLLWTLASALLFQPALMGPARREITAADATSSDRH